MKKLAIFFVTLFLLSSLVAANLSLPNYSYTIDRGDSDSNTQSVTNTENTNISVSYSATTLTDGGNNLNGVTSISPNPQTLGALASGNLQVDINVPTSTVPGTYTGNLNWDYSINGSPSSGASTITVTVVNQAPTITSIANQIATVGTPFSLQVQANDAENDGLTYSLSGEPTGMTISGSGLIQHTPTGAGTNTITVTVNDGYDPSTETFQYTAQNDAPDVTIVSSTIDFGDDNQDRGEQISETVTIQNTGTQTLNNLAATLESTTGGTFGADYNGQVSLGTTTLAPGATTTATITLDVPLDQDSEQTVIGRLNVEGDANTQTVSDTASLTMEARSYLKIDKVEIEIDGDDESLDDGDVFDEIQEGDKVKITVTLENTYSDSDNIEIEDAYFEIEADDSDWDDIDEESDEQDIKEDDSEEFVIEFTLDDDIDEDETEVTLKAFGEDEDNGFEHYDEITFTFEIDRVRDEIKIISWEFDKSLYTCNDNFAELSLRIKNTGTDDQDEVTLEVQADELDWHERLRDLELDEGDSEDYEFNIPLSGSETDEYFVDIEVFYDNDDESDDEVATISFVCNDGSSPSGTTSPTVPAGTTRPSQPIAFPTEVLVVGNNDANAALIDATYGEPLGAFDDFRNSNLYVGLLVALMAFVLVGVAVLGFNLIKK